MRIPERISIIMEVLKSKDIFGGWFLREKFIYIYVKSVTIVIRLYRYYYIRKEKKEKKFRVYLYGNLSLYSLYELCDRMTYTLNVDCELPY